MADNNIGYLAIPVQTITTSQVISANKGRHYVLCDSEAGDITVSITGTDKFKYYFVNVNAEFNVNFNINGETAVLSQYDCIILQKPLDNSADIHVINPTLGIS